MFWKKKENNLKKSVEKIKTFTTSKFLLQVLLSDVEGVEIVSYKKNEFDKAETITFSYSNISEKKVQALLDDFYNDVFKDVVIEGFSEMKKIRKNKIDEYFKKLKAGKI